ncbi:MAG: DUF2142 domain-containing protein [Pseudomonadota bacterium]
MSYSAERAPSIWRRFLAYCAGAAPHDVYSALAITFGLAFLILTPPTGAADEPAHFQRGFEVANGYWLGAEGAPAGVDAFLDPAFATVEAGGAFSRDDVRAWTEPLLQKGETVPYDNPHEAVMRIHNPLAYLPYAPAIWAGQALEAPAYVVFQLCRLTTLFAGVLLMRKAIMIAPAHQWTLTAVALTPTSLFFLAAVNLDAFLVGACFLFSAFAWRFAADRDRILTEREILILSALGVMIAALKTPYALLVLSAAALPSEKFASVRMRARALAVIAAPSVVVAAGWAMIAKAFIVGDIAYSTPAAGLVSPSEQAAWMAAHPAAFANVVMRTIFDGGAVLRAVVHSVSLMGWNSVATPGWAAALSFIAMGVAFLAERMPQRARDAGARIVAAGTIVAILLASLAIIYMQWNGIGAARIEGFQGRYLLPLSPLAIAAASLRRNRAGLSPPIALIVPSASALSAIGGLAAVFAAYY